MKKSILSMILLLPFSALAHEGHGGLGLFHHMYDLLPVIGAIVIVLGLWLVKKRR
ncbi:hypothetical protein [Shewanella sp. Scap07]|uniref:hypothetical protein n=1 Tax=Shewanella sp. Scap07 TaxID=2589987 RepID=UPI0015BB307D|nr:hypothetical protein [Shewanella sp. Scap07]